MIQKKYIIAIYAIYFRTGTKYNKKNFIGYSNKKYEHSKIPCIIIGKALAMDHLNNQVAVDAIDKQKYDYRLLECEEKDATM